MNRVYAIGTNVVSPLGLDTTTNWKHISGGIIGVKEHSDTRFSASPFWGAMLDPVQWDAIRNGQDHELTRFEQLCLYSVRQALITLSKPIDLSETILILSTTKGNIESLEQACDDQVLLASSARKIAYRLGITSVPVVISQACISGVAATIYGQRLLQSGRCRHVIVIGGDLFTKFVLSGFRSFQAIADEPCKPFDKNRKGINLGEASATIVLSVDEEYKPLAELRSGSTSNDANHISGPSRTGDGLAMAIRRALKQGGIAPGGIDMISAHGTATLYNDEMEAKAFAAAGTAYAPVYSLKGYFGHTLGAAGILETAMLIESIRHRHTIQSAGFTVMGVEPSLLIVREPTPANIKTVLKTASGFGGCNAATVWGEVVD